MSEEYAEIFREEATELLEELESALLELENNPKDLKIVGRVFRAMHTIKGSGAMFGFEAIAGFTHHVETVLDKVRDGSVPVSRALIDLTLASRDHIFALLDAAAGKGSADEAQGKQIIDGLSALMAAGGGGEKDVPAGENTPEPSPKAKPQKQAAKPATLTHYRIHIQPEPVFFENGGDVDQLIAELGALGECTVFLHQLEGAKKTASSGKAGPVWEVLLTTDKGEDAIRDVLIFAESSCLIALVPLLIDENDEFPEHRKLGEILVERGELDPKDLVKILGEQKPVPLGEMLVAAKLVSPTKVEAALAEQKLVEKDIAARSVKGADSIRVGADKLDRLINLVGELVVTQARLTQVSSNLREATELVEPVEEVERLTAELRDCVLNIRMVPIGTSFARFRRLVRDLSAELGKEIVMETEGAETELDKNVIDQLGDPLVHLIRNSIDHGIELPADRETAGKPRTGTIRLTASHAGANVVISVTDDGRGLDVDRIREKGIEKGMFRADQEISHAEILNTIFAPGLSTAATVTSVSGRGVGMDVVKNTVEGLKGTVLVTDSELGGGTTVSITLPLTLAIIDGLLVRVGPTHFVLPLGQVEECVELTSHDIDRFHGRRMMPVRDQLVPYVRLRDFFGIGGERPELEQMVIVNNRGDRSGLVLDDVVGEHQTVLKSLGWIYRNAAGLSGSTILGNGEVALIIDVMGVIRCAKTEETAAAREYQ